jgi:aminoglycoside 6'-N-acetyltransferase
MSQVNHQGNKGLAFVPMQEEHLYLWHRWSENQHVKEVWFIEGYEPADYITQKIRGNGYDYPFIIYLDDNPIGFIQCCDLFSYKTIAENPSGLFTDEEKGTYCIDLFIGEKEYLNKGYGTQIVKLFSELLFDRFTARKILIDPASTNKRAIRCYEKAGFQFVGKKFDGVTNCTVMMLSPPH